MKTRSQANEWSAAVAGALLLVLALGGAAWGVRAAIAQTLYYRGRYVAAAAGDDRAARLLALCTRAQRLYPFNYHFCAHVAEEAYWSGASNDAGAGNDRRRAARLWCGRGLALNPHGATLHRLMTRLLWDEDPDRAIDYWSARVDWDFWQPGHHGFLARLYADVGDFRKAEDELRWAKGGAGYADDKAHVERVRKAFLEGDGG